MRQHFQPNYKLHMALHAFDCCLPESTEVRCTLRNRKPFTVSLVDEVYKRISLRLMRSLHAPIKFVLLSVRIFSGIPRLEMNLLLAKRQCSFVRHVTSSICTAFVPRQINKEM